MIITKNFVDTLQIKRDAMQAFLNAFFLLSLFLHI